MARAKAATRQRPARGGRKSKAGANTAEDAIVDNGAAADAEDFDADADSDTDTESEDGAVAEAEPDADDSLDSDSIDDGALDIDSYDDDSEGLAAAESLLRDKQGNARDLAIRRAIEERREARRLKEDLDYLDLDD